MFFGRNLVFNVKKFDEDNGNLVRSYRAGKGYLSPLGSFFVFVLKFSLIFLYTYYME